MQLYHNSSLIGLLSSPCANGFDMHALIELTPQAEEYKYLFEAFASLEELEKLAPPQPVYENWAIVNEEGERLEIGLPGIFKQDDALHVMWRYY
ncbi:MAG: hypothetical protein QG574_4215 [Cyanobacteriota bacterium erpe_2018_sw_21hr_WHONDRS-SW48-000092_B_bin.40]|nr:hypothetical protein [Cyanobacteriota bacterium erpe_2018_sw_21hr_WHONDRS-SW48-000092_B_bin.40]